MAEHFVQFRALVCLLLCASWLAACGKGELAVTSVAPGSGVLGGNEPVTIAGSGFQQGMGIDVFFGPVKAPSVVVEGSRRLVVTTPAAHKASIVDVRIQTDQGKNITLSNAFQYVDTHDVDVTDGFGGKSP